LHRSIGAEPESLDPHTARSAAAGTILRDLGEGLTSFSPGGEVIPGLAAGWEISTDRLEYRFTIRPQARWSDGTPITAADFVYSFRRLVDPATAAFNAGLLSVVLNAPAISQGRLPPRALGVTALDDGQLRISLSRPTPYFLQLLSFPATFPVSRRSVERYGEGFARPGRLLSSGAYLLVDRVVGSRILLGKNPRYWNADATRIDRVIYYPLSDSAAELLRFRAGELDITTTIPPGSFARLSRALPTGLKVAPYLATYYLGFNLAAAPVAGNTRLRRALSLAIDRAVITHSLLGNGERPAWSWTPPGVGGYVPPRPAEADWTPAQRLAEARRLFRAAGFSADHLPSLEIRINSGETHRRIAVAVQSMWREAFGFQARVVEQEFRVMLGDIRAGRVQGLFRGSWIADFADPWSFAQVLKSDSSTNMTGYANPEYDALLQRAAGQTDADARYHLLAEAEKLVLEDVPLIPVYHYVSKHLVRDRVGGWHRHPLDFHLSRDLYLVGQSGGR